MTSGVGNPDWQRRYTTSAASLVNLTYADDVNRIGGPFDTNGFQYLLVTTNSGTSNVYARVKVDWYQDAATTLSLGTTAFVISPRSFNVVKVPVITRYYKVEIGPVGGTSGGSIVLVIYGTNADQENLLTQNTDVPEASIVQSVGAGLTVTTVVGGIFGGEVMLSFSDDTNKLWTQWLEYYDWTSQAWIKFWLAHGADKGQSYAEKIYIPYAPVRMNCRNDDTVSHFLTQAMVCP